MLTLTLSTLGLPLEGVGLLLAIDPILDMMRTATNVAGQALVPAIVAKREGILDQDVFDGSTFATADRRLDDAVWEQERALADGASSPDRSSDEERVPAGV